MEIKPPPPPPPNKKIPMNFLIFKSVKMQPKFAKCFPRAIEY